MNSLKAVSCQMRHGPQRRRVQGFRPENRGCRAAIAPSAIARLDGFRGSVLSQQDREMLRVEISDKPELACPVCQMGHFIVSRKPHKPSSATAFVGGRLPAR